MISSDRRIEAILFALARSLSLKELGSLLDLSSDEVRSGVDFLSKRLTDSDSGLQLIEQGSEVELVTNSALADDVRKALKQEVSAELSKPSLETLSILAYRGPLTRPEIEQIRGIQSSLMIRNLILRGLVELHEEERLGQPTYRVTASFFKQLGLASAEDLPNYQELRHSTTVVQILDELGTSQVS